MEIAALAVAAADLRQMVSGDGADLRLVRLDLDRRQVILELDLSAAGCGDCVLPPDRLHEMLDATLHREHPGDYDVIVRDPRVDGGTAVASVTASMITVLDPSARAAVGDDSPGPDAGPLAGRRVGLRVDVLWRSWDWVVEEWVRALEAAGATTEVWRRVQGLDGTAGDEHAKEFEQFLESVDVAIVGLGNCGSCTSWTIKDAVAAANTGVPTIAATTAQFEQLGHTLAQQYGRSGLRIHVLPYPLDTRPEDEVREVARAAFVPMLSALGAVV